MKKGLSLLMIMVLVFGLMPLSDMTFAMENPLTITVHYHRFDENYDGWNLWVWAKGSEGQSFAFSEADEFGQVANFTLEDIGDASEVGFIVRKGEWEAKDIDADRFVSLDKINDQGELEFFLLQGSENIYYDAGEIDLSPKFLKADFIDETTLKLVTSKPIAKADLRSDFAVTDSEGTLILPIAVSGGSGELSTEFVILLDSNVAFNTKYETKYLDYEPIMIEQSGLYDTDNFINNYTYVGELGAIYNASQTVFKVWAPTADGMVLNLYDKGDGGNKLDQVVMQNSGQGVWTTIVNGDLNGTYYTYTIISNDSETETYDPYAHAAGVNGDRSMVIDMAKTNPSGWEKDKGPIYIKANDLIVYEMHIRDISSNVNSNISNKGKFLGVIEKGSKTDNGVSTGLDHLKELGITHVQILPMFDYNSVDETKLEENTFNWGYDPKNYSVPEGSYASDPYHGEVRVAELKQMIQGLHSEGIGVVMDVVYNHTALTADSNLTKLVPNYYYRMVAGKYSNASGTGNETASERAMMQKLMVDSLKHWVSEYHIDGFRFDLMGVHDIETMRLIDNELRKINPNIILYGEGWTGGSSPLPEAKRLVKANIQSIPRIGAFDDDFRDGIKGHVFNPTEAGFANGAIGFEESVKFGIVGATTHDQIDYKKVNYSKKAWAENPSQSVNYVSAHDNLTLWDKISVTNPDATEDQKIAMDRLSNAIVLTSQGMPFLHAGVDFLRTKNGDENSYKSSDEINGIDWTLKESNLITFNYYKGLIEIRKAYPAFSLGTKEEVQDNLKFFDQTADSLVTLPDQMVGYSIKKGAGGSTNEELIVLFNGKLEAQSITLPEGNFKILVNDKNANKDGISVIQGGLIQIPASSALILERTLNELSDTELDMGIEKDSPTWIIIVSIAIVVIVAIVIGFIYLKRNKLKAIRKASKKKFK
jgi:pullulanase, type I